MSEHKASYYIDGVLHGDKRVLARAITLIESARPDHQQLAADVLDALLDHTGNATRLGLTGVPGAGKSTFIESLGMYLVNRGQRVAVLAVDPSSSRSGGSVLADKTRMELLSTSPQAFIRPSPSGGTLGGVARKTRESMLLCEAAGFEVIIVETVGVGQSETAVASMVDFFMVLMIAGAGDELQGIKKGLLELADGIVVNKADGDNIARAEEARKTYENAIHLLSPASPNWTVPVLTCSSMESKGIDRIWDIITTHKKKLSATGELQAKRKEQATDWMWALIEEGLKLRFHHNRRVVHHLPAVIEAVEQGRLAPLAAAKKLLFLLDNQHE
jgi:LAO/AO transport system kinase